MNNTSLKNRMSSKVQAIADNTAVAVPDQTGSEYIALAENTMDIIRENLKHQPLSFQLFDLV